MAEHIQRTGEINVRQEVPRRIDSARSTIEQAAMFSSVLEPPKVKKGMLVPNTVVWQLQQSGTIPYNYQQIPEERRMQIENAMYLFHAASQEQAGNAQQAADRRQQANQILIEQANQAPYSTSLALEAFCAPGNTSANRMDAVRWLKHVRETTRKVIAERKINPNIINQKIQDGLHDAEMAALMAINTGDVRTVQELASSGLLPRSAEAVRQEVREAFKKAGGQVGGNVDKSLMTAIYETMPYSYRLLVGEYYREMVRFKVTDLEAQLGKLPGVEVKNEDDRISAEIKVPTETDDYKRRCKIRASNPNQEPSFRISIKPAEIKKVSNSKPVETVVEDKEAEELNAQEAELIRRIREGDDSAALEFKKLQAENRANQATGQNLGERKGSVVDGVIDDILSKAGDSDTVDKLVERVLFGLKLIPKTRGFAIVGEEIYRKIQSRRGNNP